MTSTKVFRFTALFAAIALSQLHAVEQPDLIQAFDADDPKLGFRVSSNLGVGGMEVAAASTKSPDGGRVNNVAITFYPPPPERAGDLAKISVFDARQPATVTYDRTGFNIVRFSGVTAHQHFYKSALLICSASGTLYDGTPTGMKDIVQIAFSDCVPANPIGPQPPPARQSLTAEVTAGNLVVTDPLSISIQGARLSVVEGEAAQLILDVTGARFEGTRDLRVIVKAAGQNKKAPLLKVKPGRNLLRISLPALNVPRFEENAILGIEAEAVRLDMRFHSAARSGRQLAVLLPVVVIPGIAPPDADAEGGDGTYRVLEERLKAVSNSLISNSVSATAKYLGEGYRLWNEGYWSMSTLKYPRNRSSMAQGSDLLRQHILKVIVNTYANKVILVTHSYGGLIARHYIQNTAGSLVARFVQAEAPNMGSLLAMVGQRTLPLIGEDFNYTDIFPLFPYEAATYGSQFGGSVSDAAGKPVFRPMLPAPPNQLSEADYLALNPALARLNGLAPPAAPHFPATVPYTIVYSGGHATQWGEVKGNPPAWLYCVGDGVVPAFSQRGIVPLNPNSIQWPPLIELRTAMETAAQRIPALRTQGIRLLEVKLSGPHAGYIESSAVLSFLWNYRLGCDLLGRSCSNVPPQ